MAVLDEIDVQAWIIEAREHGTPVVVTGLVLFAGVLGWPMSLVTVLLGLLCIAVLLGGARSTFRPVCPPADS